MNPMLNIAIQAIRQGGNFIIKQYEIFNTSNIKTIEHKNNLLIKINERFHQLVKNTIKKYYPSHTIIAQNDYDHEKINNEIQWIINPLDSQTNFKKYFPYFASSIAIKIKGRIEISVIYDPIHNELFSAIKGKGTQLNRYRIHHNQITKKILYEDAIITCFPCFKQNIIMNILNHIQSKIVHFRYNGALTLDLAYVAAGRIDALLAINTNINKFNDNGGTLLIKEAGGLILNLNKNNNLKHNNYKNIIAGNPKFIKFLTEKTLILKKIIE